MGMNPWAGTLALSNSATAYNLYTLGQAADLGFPSSCTAFQIQADLTGGAARIYIGGPNVSALNRGVELVSGQWMHLDTPGYNGGSTTQIWVATDTGGAKINVMVQTL